VTRSRDIRAANLGELYAGGTAAGAATFTDPFTGTQVPQAFSLSSGNPTLNPEKADTTGIGVVLTPTFFEGFAAAVDYYNIDIKGAVATPNGQSIIDGCFAGLTNLCPAILRDANGRIHTVVTSPQNVAYEIVRGIDFEASYRLPVAALVESWDGDLAFRVLANYNLKTESFNPTVANNQLVNGRGVLGGFAVAGYSGRSNPRYKINSSIRYTTEAASVTLGVRYTPTGVYNNAFMECVTGCPANNNRTIDINHIASDTVVDLGMSYKPFADSEGTEVFLSITNLLNSPPPFIAGGNGSGYYSGQNVRDYDTIGRFFTMGGAAFLSGGGGGGFYPPPPTALPIRAAAPPDYHRSCPSSVKWFEAARLVANAVLEPYAQFAAVQYERTRRHLLFGRKAGWVQRSRNCARSRGPLGPAQLLPPSPLLHRSPTESPPMPRPLRPRP
jgi:hypothetical protein